jgi:hypothetical protein
LPIDIIEDYRGSFTSPSGVKASVERLLAWLPDQHKAGLSSIVLTNSSGMKLKRRRFRSRGRKIDPSDCRGIYHHGTRDAEPWIELLVDQIVPQPASWMLRFNFVADMYVSRTLFHEIGHHVDAKSTSGKNSEVIAEEWRKRLQKIYGRATYPRLRLFKPIIFSILVVALLGSILLGRAKNQT